MFRKLRLTIQAALRGEIRLVIFLLVGGLNTLVGYCIFATALWVGMHYSLAVAFSTVLGVMFNFKSTGALVFQSRDNSKIVRFVGVYVCIYFVNVLGLYLLVPIGFNPYQGGIVMILPLALLSYWMNSRYVFRE